MSQRQLHWTENRSGPHEVLGREAVWGGSRRRAAALNAVEPLDRPVWSGQRAYKRDAQNPVVDQDGIEGRGGGTSNVLTRGDLHRSVINGRREGGNDDLPMLMEKSDSFILASMPVKVGGAKGGMD